MDAEQKQSQQKQIIRLGPGHAQEIIKYFPDIAEKYLVVKDPETDPKKINLNYFTLARPRSYADKDAEGTTETQKYILEAELNRENLRQIFDPKVDQITEMQADVLSGLQQEVASISTSLYSDIGLLIGNYEALSKKPELLAAKLEKLEAKNSPGLTALSLINDIIPALKELCDVAERHIPVEAENYASQVQEESERTQKLLATGQKKEMKPRIEPGPNMRFVQNYETLVGNVEVITDIFMLVNKIFQSFLFKSPEERDRISPQEKQEQIVSLADLYEQIRKKISTMQSKNSGT